METKLYVGNLPYDTSEEDLQTMFGEAGAVKSAQLIKDRDSGRSKGFGFVEMTTQEEAQNAIKIFNGRDMGGRGIVVNLARPREERAPGGGGGAGRDRFRGGPSGGRGGRRNDGPRRG